MPTDLLAVLLHGGDDELRDAVQRVVASRGKGDRSQVSAVEDEVAAAPERGITFDASGLATVRGAGREFCGGRFSTPSVGELRQAVVARPAAPSVVRFSVLEGDSPATDIGALQAMAPDDTLFQAASQFNCLESPGPYLSRVAEYLIDPTQGPRASVSAFPAALVRTYAAPDGAGGRFVQVPDRQIELLADALPASIGRVESGYLQLSRVRDREAAAESLEARFEHIRVGVHDEAQVVLGHAWDGAVEGEPRIAQVFTSTLAAAGYGGGEAFEGPVERICRSLLRAAYLGTLLAAIHLGKSRVVLTLIGGGVFGNPHPLILSCALWAADEAERLGRGSLEIVLNGRDLAGSVDRERLRQECARRGGVYRVRRAR